MRLLTVLRHIFEADRVLLLSHEPASSSGKGGGVWKVVASDPPPASGPSYGWLHAGIDDRDPLLRQGWNAPLRCCFRTNLPDWLARDLGHSECLILRHTSERNSWRMVLIAGGRVSGDEATCEGLYLCKRLVDLVGVAGHHGFADSEVAEALDVVMRGYQPVLPAAVQTGRLAMFTSQLGSLTMFFQPIVRLDAGKPFIHGHEALVRTVTDGRARWPGELLDAAALWGHEFMWELDKVCVAKALSAFGKHNLPRECFVFVNVHTASVAQPEEFARFFLETCRQSGVSSDRVVIEVSEQELLPQIRPADAQEVARTATFKSHIRDLRKTFAFAIDDFGVHYSNCARVMHFHPRYVKVDVELTQTIEEERLEATLKYLVDVTSWHQGEVVLEGVDGHKKEKARRAYQSGVQYVQGFCISEAVPEPLSDLTTDHITWLQEACA